METERIVVEEPRDQQPNLEEPAPKRRRLWVWLFCLFALPLLAVVLGVTYILLSVTSEPEFYQSARLEVEDPEVRRVAAEEFEKQAEELAESIETHQTWEARFTQKQINAWLISRISESRPSGWPKAIQDPLVELNPDSARIGCRLERDGYSGIVSIQLGSEIQADNELLVEIIQIQAGDLPIPANRLLEEVAQSIQNEDIPLQIEFAEQTTARFQLEEIFPVLKDVELNQMEFADGELRISGQGKSAPKAN